MLALRAVSASSEARNYLWCGFVGKFMNHLNSGSLRVARLLLAGWLPGAIISLLRPQHEQPISVPLVLDIPVLGYTLLLSVGTAIVFGLIPALRASRTNPNSASKGEITTLGHGGGRLRLHSMLVGTQV
jgi:hypothetical protein